MYLENKIKGRRGRGRERKRGRKGERVGMVSGHDTSNVYLHPQFPMSTL